MMLIGIVLALLIAWFFLSQLLAEAIIDLGVEAPKADESMTIRAGMFMLPTLLMLMFLTYATWHAIRFANYMQYPGFGPAEENPMEYL